MEGRLKHLIFLISYIYFLISDIRQKKIKNYALLIYGIVGVLLCIFEYRILNFTFFKDTLLSIGFGMIIMFVSCISKEGIGKADGIYFILNGLYLSLSENVSLFLSGIFVAFIFGMVLIVIKREKKYLKGTMPFMPCLLPMVIGYIICIQ